MTFVDYFPEEGLWLIGRLSEKLMARNMLMGTAESCTGGLTATLCTNVPGSSRWFSGAIVAYSNKSKNQLLGVDSQLISRFGAVSSQVVEAMAVGGLNQLESSICIAISGIAGPDGGLPEKPVGTVWFATAMKQRNSMNVVIKSFENHFSGDRLSVRFAAAFAAVGAVDEAVSQL